MIRDLLAKLRTNLMRQTGKIDDYVYVMSVQNYNDFVRECESISNCKLHGITEFMGHTIIIDSFIAKDNMLMMLKEDYSRNVNAFAEMLKGLV